MNEEELKAAIKRATLELLLLLNQDRWRPLRPSALATMIADRALELAHSGIRLAQRANDPAIVEMRATLERGARAELGELTPDVIAGARAVAEGRAKPVVIHETFARELDSLVFETICPHEKCRLHFRYALDRRAESVALDEARRLVVEGLATHNRLVHP